MDTVIIPALKDSFISLAHVRTMITVRISCFDNSGNPRDEGEKWIDPTDKCISYACIKAQVVKSVKTCLYQGICTAEKFWDADHCCYWCPPGSCKKLFVSKNVTMENSSCSAEVNLTKCEGNCAGSSEFDTVTNTMINKCSCCFATKTENRSVNLDCGNGESVPYTYTYITSCELIPNMGLAQLSTIATIY
uniref:integumentary mucin B.1-like n=1 Tax=Pristiophorus japonicus TaxID=55135 RepID=UPI00398ED9A7